MKAYIHVKVCTWKKAKTHYTFESIHNPPVKMTGMIKRHRSEYYCYEITSSYKRFTQQERSAVFLQITKVDTTFFHYFLLNARPRQLNLLKEVLLMEESAACVQATTLSISQDISYNHIKLTAFTCASLHG